jgi:hypothetical protein
MGSEVSGLIGAAHLDASEHFFSATFLPFVSGAIADDAPD